MAAVVTIDIAAELIDNVTDKLTQMDALVDKLNAKNIKITPVLSDNISSKLSEIETLSNKLDGKNSTVTVNLMDNISSKMTELTELLSKLSDKKATITAELVDNASEKLSEIEARVENLSGKTVTINATASVDSTSVIGSAKSSASAIEKTSSENSLKVAEEVDKAKRMTQSSEYQRVSDDVLDRAVANVFDTQSSVMVTSSNEPTLIPESKMGYDREAMQAVYGTTDALSDSAEATKTAGEAMTDAAATIKKSASAVTSVDDYFKGSAMSGASLAASQLGVGNAMSIRRIGSSLIDSYRKSGASGLFGTSASLLGVFGTAYGIMDGISDLTDGFSADNAIDAGNSKTTGAITLASTGIGAVLGGIIGSAIPVGGTMTGAALGGAAGTAIGEGLSYLYEGSHKSWDELTEDAIEKYFGDVSLSSSQIPYLASSLLGRTQILEENGYSDSQSELVSQRSGLQSTANSIKQAGSRLQIFNAKTLDNTESDVNSFADQIKSFATQAIDYLDTQMYNELSAADDLLGSGNELVTPISEKYGEAIELIQKYQDKISDFLEDALEDGQLDESELNTLLGYKSDIQDTINKYTEDAAKDQIDALMWLSENGMLSKETFDETLSQMSDDLSDLQLEVAMERSANMRNGMSESEATNAAYARLTPEIESTAGSMLNFARTSINDDLTYDRESSQTALDKYVEQQLGVLSGYRSFSASDLRTYLGIDKESSYGGANSNPNRGINEESQAAYSTMYDSFNQSGLIKTLENTAQAGYATAEITSSLMGLYEIGAYGGNEDAMQRFFGMRMAQSAYGQEVMESLLANGSIGEEQQALIDAYNWAIQSQNSSAQTATETTEPTAAETTETPVLETAETTPAEITSNAESEITANTELTSEALENGIEKWPQTATESANAAADEVKANVDTIAQDILSSIDESFANLDASQLGDLQIGSTIMQAIGESITNMSAENSGNLDIGQNVLDSINASFSNLDASQLGDLQIGSTIMQAIGESITNMSAENFGNLDIGTSVVSAVNASLSGADFSTIGTGLSEQISVSLSSLVCTPEITLSPTYTLADGGASLSSLIASAIQTVSSLEITATLTLNSSAVDTYTPADKTATAIYQLDSSAVDGWTPPNKTATVTYTVVMSGGHFATGTEYAPGGLSTINDQITSDPRELVIHDDMGYIFSGRNVSVPLSRGDRVFTADQTQRMLSGRYQSGYDNSDILSDAYLDDYAYDDKFISDNSNVPAIDFGTGQRSNIGTSVNLGGVTMNFEISGEAQDVVSAIEENTDKIAGMVARKIQRELSDNFANTPAK